MQSTTTIQPANPPKNSILAAVLSLGLLGGVGQMYLGQTKKGILLIAATILLACIGIGALIPFVVAYDAEVIGEKRKTGQAVGDMELFWQAQA
jgi:TM2 domain-containing membrane protein YozV